MSVDCDCAGINAAPVKARRHPGIYRSSGCGKSAHYTLLEAELHDLKERIESRMGLRQLFYMKEIKMGKDRYDLIKV